MQAFIIGMLIVVLIALIYSAIVKDNKERIGDSSEEVEKSQNPFNYEVTKTEDSVTLVVSSCVLKDMQDNPKAYPELQAIFKVSSIVRSNFSNLITILVGNTEITRTVYFYKTLSIYVTKNTVRIY